MKKINEWKKEKKRKTEKEINRDKKSGRLKISHPYFDGVGFKSSR